MDPRVNPVKGNIDRVRPGWARRATLALLVVGLQAVTAVSAQAAIVVRDYERRSTLETLAGSSEGAALVIRLGDRELTLAGGQSSAAYQRRRFEIADFDVDDPLVTACGPEAVPVAAAPFCLSRKELEARGVQVPRPPVDTAFLEQLGLGRWRETRTTATILPGSGRAASTSRGLLLIPASSVDCSEIPAGETSIRKRATGLSTPAQLDPPVMAHIAATRCEADIAGLPVATHGADEASVALTLTETLVDATDLNTFLDQVQAALPLPADVDNAVDALQENVESQPVMTITVAPNDGTVRSTETGIASTASGATITVSVLGGLLEIQIGVGAASAAIDGSPRAAADVSFVRVRAHNVFTSDPSDALIDQSIQAPNDLELFAGTPLETRIATDRATTAETCDSILAGDAVDPGLVERTGLTLSPGHDCAAARSDGLSVRLLADPFPTIGIDLVRSQALAVRSTATAEDRPELPLTGPESAATVAAGTGLAGAALLTRRWLLR